MPLAAMLDTLRFSGLSEAEFRKRALAGRSGLSLYEHADSFIRRRHVTAPGQDRPTLVILPDGPATIESYDAFIEAVLPDFDVLLMEIPGFGFSFARKGRAMSFAATADILNEALEDMALGRTVLVGPCVQGLFAARMAERRPALTDALIVAQTGDIPASQAWASSGLDPKGLLAKPWLGQIGFRRNRSVTIDWWLPYAAGPSLPVERLQDVARAVQAKGCAYALASQLQWLSRLGPDDLPRPTQPTAILWGLEDRSHRDTDRRSALNLSPAATYGEHAAIGHFVDLEDPDLIRDTALALLDAQPD
ncbi:MAG: alpha/beta hydrolase [Litorimonas sp.]